MTKKNRKIIFTNGIASSGTTFLGLMLANTNRGVAIGEAFHLFRDTVFDCSEIQCRCFESDCSLWAEIEGKDEATLYEYILEQFPTSDYITDSGTIDWTEDQIDQHPDFDKFLVCIFKHPLQWKKSMDSKHESPLDLSNYFERYARILKCQDQLGDFFMVQTSDLQTNPSETLDRLDRELGLPREEEQVKYWQKIHHIVGGSPSAVFHLLDKGTPEYEKFVRDHPLYREKESFQNHRSIYRNKGAPSFKEVDEDNNHPALDLFKILLDIKESQELAEPSRRRLSNLVTKTVNWFEPGEFSQTWFEGILSLNKIINDSTVSAILSTYSSISEDLDQVNEKRQLDRFTARKLRDSGQIDQATKHFQKALNIEAEDDMAIGDWYNLFHISGKGTNLRKKAMEHLKKMKPSLLSEEKRNLK